MVWKPKTAFAVLNTVVSLLFGVLLVLALALVESQRAAKLETLLQQAGTELADSIREDLRASVEDLRSISSLLTTIEDIDFATFSRFAGRYIERDQGLLILEWQPLVAEYERAGFVQRARAQGLDTFRLWQPDDEGRPILAETRPIHVPVYFMLSQHSGTDTTGLDLAWSEERMASKWAARDSGQPQSSGFFTVITAADEGYTPPGLAITLPIYADGIVPVTPIDRRGKLLGYLAGVFAIDSLLADDVRQLTARQLNVAVTDDSGGEIGVFSHAGDASEHELVIPLRLYGNEWRLRLTATETLADDIDEPIWALLPAMTGLLGIAVLSFLYLFQRKNVELASAQQQLSVALDRVRQSEAHLRDLSLHDPLTGLCNRRAFIQQLDHEIDRGARHGLASALLLLDLDHFKSINDSWGHPAGDRVLQHFSAVCNEVSRSSDIAARIGGEEFAILLPHTDSEQASIIAERLRQRVADARIPFEGSPEPLKVTVSIGIATTDPDTTSESLIGRADKALYRAKQLGRNRVEVSR